MDKLKLMVLFGGMSEEHPVSIKSARAFAKHLDPEKYESIYMFIGRDGAWRRVESPEGDLAGGASATLSVDRECRGLVMNENGRFTTMDIDVAFPLLHGRYGEDGAVQGASGTVRHSIRRVRYRCVGACDGQVADVLGCRECGCAGAAPQGL